MSIRCLRFKEEQVGEKYRYHFMLLRGGAEITRFGLEFDEKPEPEELNRRVEEMIKEIIPDTNLSPIRRIALMDRLIVEHRNRKGELLHKYDSGWGFNGITNAGMAEVAGLLLTDVGGTAFDYIAIGTGTTAFDPSQTALASETHRENATGTRVTTSVTNDTAQLEHTFSGYSGSESITESGVFNASSGGTMLCRQTFSAISVDWGAGDTLKVTWKIQIKQG